MISACMKRLLSILTTVLLCGQGALLDRAERFLRWEYFSPAILAAKLRNYFGPWHGRLALSTEVISDTADRSTFSAEAQLKRKWESDEVQLNGRYDYSDTNTLTTTDLVKG